MKYSYAIIQSNFASLQNESALLENKYNPKKKYAFIEKLIHKDGSESIANIYYSNDLEALQTRAAGMVSWYNYPLNLSKNMQGYIKNIN